MTELLAQITTVLATILTSATSIASWVIATPLAMLSVGLGVTGFAIGVIKSFR